MDDQRHTLGVEVRALVVFQGFRRLVDAIQALAAALMELTEIQRQLGPALNRLDELERHRTHFEAHCEGTLLKAEGKLKAAHSAEQRERQLKKTNERTAESFDLEGDPQPERGTDVLFDDAKRSETERVSPVRVAVAPTNKTVAQRAKFGVR